MLWIVEYRVYAWDITDTLLCISSDRISPCQYLLLIVVHINTIGIPLQSQCVSHDVCVAWVVFTVLPSELTAKAMQYFKVVLLWQHTGHYHGAIMGYQCVLLQEIVLTQSLLLSLKWQLHRYARGYSASRGQGGLTKTILKKTSVRLALWVTQGRNCVEPFPF